MSALVEITGLLGKWQGTNNLWLSPEDPVRKSVSDAEIKTTAQDQFTEIRYTWTFEGVTQEGRLILGKEVGTGRVRAAWFDTWHMRDQFMVCEGASEEKGTVWVAGSYAAPPGPDWGWRITIEQREGSVLNFLMHNISPEGEEMLAVEAKYTRQR